MTADQPRDAAIAALDDLVERWHAWNATDDPDLKVMLGLGLMQDAFDALPNLAALAPADQSDLRAALDEYFAALDAVRGAHEARLAVGTDWTRLNKRHKDAESALRALTASTTEDEA